MTINSKSSFLIVYNLFKLPVVHFDNFVINVDLNLHSWPLPIAIGTKGWNEDFFDSPSREGKKAKESIQNAQRV
jgi:hypothetical protein